MGATGPAGGVTRWVAELPANDVARAAAIRLDLGAEGAAVSGEPSFWLRGEELSNAVLSLPFLEIYRIEKEAENCLFPLNSELPSRRLPENLIWQPVVDLVIPKPEVPLFPGDDFLQPAMVGLVRGGPESIPNLLRVSRAVFREFVEKAPQIRLDPLSFAASETEVIVRGNPLPPIRGELWVEHEGIAIPVGHVFSPAIAPEVLHLSMGMVPGEIGLISADGVVDRIALENFVPVSRSTVRATMS